MKSYKFDKELIEGIIVERHRSFIMLVEIDGKKERCFCPCISAIGHIELNGRPCLLWDSENPNRKTRYTVKAVSLNRPEDKKKKWFGIDQIEANKYVEHYLKQNAFPKMIDCKDKEVLHEQTIGNSRLDFKVGDTYIENKTILRLDMPIPDYIKTKKKKKPDLSDHFYKHIKELRESLKLHERAILVGTFLYDNGNNLIEDEQEAKYSDVNEILSAGVESWQINFEINPREVKLVSYFEI